MPPEQNQPYYYDTTRPSDPNRRKRLIIGVSGLLIFVFAVIVVVIVLLAGPDHRTALGEIAATQREAARVAELGLDSDRTRRATRIFAANTQAVAGTHVQEIAGLVDESYGQPLADSTIESAENTDIDSTIEVAEQEGTVDEKVVEILKVLLEDTNQTINTESEDIDDETTLTVLSEIFADNVKLLESL